MTCAAIPNVCKPATAARSYIADFSLFAEILQDGDTLTGTPTMTATPTGLTVGAASVLAADTSGVRAGTGIAAVISGGTVGVTYEITATASTVGGATLVALFTITAE